MMSEAMKAAGLGEIDPNLLEEAFRRAMRSPSSSDVDPAAVLAAIFAEARAGTRHMYGLVAAGARERAQRRSAH